MAVPVALHAGVQEEVLLLIGIAQYPLVNQLSKESVARVSVGGYRGFLINQEVVDLRHEVAAGEQCLEEAAPRLVAHAGQIGVVVAVM